MSTNYYYKPTSGSFSAFNALHIGKSSFGWQFHFQAYSEQAGPQSFENHLSKLSLDVTVPSLMINSVQDWRNFMNDNPGTIQDEYGVQWTPAEFWELVGDLSPGQLAGGKALLNHVDELIRKEAVYGKVDPTQDWKDSEGFSFGLRNFS